MYAIRAIQFFLQGRKQFTNKGYASNSASFRPDDLKVDLSGQHIIVTGANSGIGFSAAKQLAELGAAVHLVCRNKIRGQEALDNLISSVPSSKDRVYLHECDMSNTQDIKLFAETYISRQFPLNCLVQNAGVMVNQKTKSTQGIEINLATNVVGMYLLTELLLPLLSKNEGKVIVVSSGGMLTQPLEIDDLQMEKGSFDGTKQYAKNKRQQVAMVERWASMYSNQGEHQSVMFYSMHPGWVDTPALPIAMPDFYKKFKNELRTCDQGADTIVWLACKPKGELQSGQFYFDRKIAEKHLSVAFTSHSKKDVDSLFAKVSTLSQKQ